MSWIEEIPEDEASGELAEVYAALIAQRGKVANILKVHSLNPGAMQKHLDLYMHLLFGKSGLSRADREAIAVVTSASNNCAYCVTHHAEALSRYEKDELAVNELIQGLKFEDRSDRTSVMLTYAGKLTRAPDDVHEADVERLRAAGFSDRDILDINLVTAYFNFVNRIALGLGVRFSDEEAAGYKE